MRVYLDNCMFNRPFDNQSQIRIRLESEAKLYIQDKIKSKVIELVWSYLHIQCFCNVFKISLAGLANSGFFESGNTAIFIGANSISVAATAPIKTIPKATCKK